MKKLIIPVVILAMLIACSERQPENINQTSENEIMEKQDKQQIESLLTEYKNSLNTSDAALAQPLSDLLQNEKEKLFAVEEVESMASADAEIVGQVSPLDTAVALVASLAARVVVVAAAVEDVRLSMTVLIRRKALQKMAWPTYCTERW